MPKYLPQHARADASQRMRRRAPTLCKARRIFLLGCNMEAPTHSPAQLLAWAIAELATTAASALLALQ
eukprot:11641059-Alexandrium_andersonii.AAC.1